MVRAIDASIVSFRADKDGEDAELSFVDRVETALPAGLTYMLLVVIFGVGNLLLTNTIEERSNKIVEILLSSVTASQLMMGKLIGIAAVGLTMPMIFLLGGLAVFIADCRRCGYCSASAGDIIFVAAFAHLPVLLCLRLRDIRDDLFSDWGAVQFLAGRSNLYGPGHADCLCADAVHAHGIRESKRACGIGSDMDSDLYALCGHDARGVKSAFMGNYWRDSIDDRLRHLHGAHYGTNFPSGYFAGVAAKSERSLAPGAARRRLAFANAWRFDGTARVIDKTPAAVAAFCLAIDKRIPN